MAGSNAIRTYFLVFMTLMGLMVLTVVVALFDMGTVSTPIAMTIATVKASLVVWFFMHVDEASIMVRFSVLSGIVFLGIFFLLIFGDYAFRPLS